MGDQLQEYVISLYSHEDLESFYEDMETPGGSLYIPNRAINCNLRRPDSRNTHYLLTKEESILLAQDPRVRGITDKSIKRIQKLLYVDQSNFWDKREWNESQTSNDKNWAQLRCALGAQITGWGTDGTPSQSGTISITSSGRNVDVIIADGLVNFNHTEFLDPTKTNNRCKYYNWYQHTNAITGGSNGTYPTPISSERDNANCNHATHVAGSVAGRTLGWAREANIYSIAAVSYQYINSLYGGIFSNWSEYELGSSYTYDYIKYFHRHKPINPVTGIRNPTIVNASFNNFIEYSRNSINVIQYRNALKYPANGTFTDSELESYGLIDYDENNVYFGAWDFDVLTSLEEMIAEGVIITGASGNENVKIADIEDLDYNNLVLQSVDPPSGYYTHRGSSNVTGANSICVGAIGKLQDDSRAPYSNTGSRINIFAPGTSIMSSVNGPTRDNGSVIVTQGVVAHPDDGSFKIQKYRGTSMASPQVAGVLACLLENNPRLTQQDCVDYLNNVGTKNQIPDTGTDNYFDNGSLKGAPNNFLYYKKQRESFGYVTAQQNNSIREVSGMVFPRRRFI